MQADGKCGKIVIKEGWAKCPTCGRKFLKVMRDTAVKNLPVKCKHCKTETVVNIEAPEPESKATSA